MTRSGQLIITTPTKSRLASVSFFLDSRVHFPLYFLGPKGTFSAIHNLSPVCVDHYAQKITPALGPKETFHERGEFAKAETRS
jgi:hypothetical protein